MRKRITTIFLAAALVCSLAGLTPAASAAEGVDYTALKGAVFCLNGENVSKMSLYQINGTVYCQLKKFCRKTLDSAEVTWTDGQAEVTGNAPSGEALSLVAKPGTRTMQVNGVNVEIPDGIRLINNSTMVPVEQLAGVFQDSSVSYDEATNTCTVTTGSALAELSEPEPAAPLTIDEQIEAFQPSGNYDPQELDMVSRIINAEAGNQSLKGKIAVGNVIMNRVASSEFPNTIYDVVYQRNQFSVVYYRSYQRTPSEESVKAAKMALDGINVVPGAVFYNVTGMSSWASRNRPYLTTLQGHDFFK